MPKVSVAIPVYNGADLVGKALDSVYSQTFRGFEVIVVDDGSTDDSAEVVSSYPNVRLIRQSNHGIGYTRQRLVEEAQGEWIAFLDHDDYWEPTKLETQIPLAVDPEVGLIHSGYGFVFPDGRVERHGDSQARCTLDHVLPNCLINNCTTVVRRQAIFEAGGFENTSCAEDWLMWLKLASQWEFVRVDQVLTWTVKREGSASAARSSWYEGERRILEDFVLPEFNDLYGRYAAEDRERIRKSIRRKLAAISSLQAEAYDREGRHDEARRCHLEALRKAPAMKGGWYRAAKHLVGSRGRDR
jgi:glycosyltransferase involved in cell wall biosynthesis